MLWNFHTFVSEKIKHNNAMIIEYSFDEDDFLTYQLFTASKSAVLLKRRKRNKILIPVIYLFLALILLIFNNEILSILFAVVGVLWFFIFPLWEKSLYKRYYRKHIRENYHQRLGRKCTIEFEEDQIIAKDSGTESRIQNSEIEKIYEIPQAIYIKLKSGPSFVLPKEKTQNLQNVKNYLQELSKQLEIAYLHEENWKWK